MRRVVGLAALLSRVCCSWPIGLSASLPPPRNPTRDPSEVRSMRLVSSIASVSSETWGPSSISISISRDGARTGTTLRTASSSTRRSKGFSK